MEVVAPIPQPKRLTQPDAVREDSRLSDEITTYYNWSESVRAINAPNNRLCTDSAASTPEMAKRSLDDTNTFQNISINESFTNGYVRSHEPSNRLVTAVRNNSHPTVDASVSSLAHDCQELTLAIPQNDCGDEPTPSHDSGHRGRNNPCYRKRSPTISGVSDVQKKSNIEPIEPAQSIIKHYSPTLGWKMDKKKRKYEKCPQHPVTPPIMAKIPSRHAIAQAAYVLHVPARPRPTLTAVDDSRMFTVSGEGLDRNAAINSRELILEDEDRGQEAPSHYHKISPCDASPATRENDILNRDGSGSMCHGEAHCPAQNRSCSHDVPPGLLNEENQLETVLATTSNEITSRRALSEATLSNGHSQMASYSRNVEWPADGASINRVAGRQMHEGLPVRGSGRVSCTSTHFQPYFVSPSMVVKPLYKIQLEQLLQESGDLSVEQRPFAHRILSSPYNHSSENHFDEEIHEAFEIADENPTRMGHLPPERSIYQSNTEHDNFYDDEAQERFDCTLDHQHVAPQDISGLHSTLLPVHRSDAVFDAANETVYGPQHYRESTGQEVDMDFTGFWRPQRYY